MRRVKKAFLGRTLFLTRLNVFQQQFLFAAALILLISIPAMWLVLREAQQAADAVLQERLRLASSFASSIDHAVEETTRVLQDAALRENFDPESEDREAMGRALNDTYLRLQALTHQVLLLDNTGRVVLARGEDVISLGTDMSRWGSAERAPGGQVSSLQRVGVEQKPVVGIIVPLGEDSQVVGALAAIVDLSLPSSFTQLQSLTAGGSSYTEVVDDQGNILASSRGEGLFQSADHAGILASLVQQKKETVRTCHSCHVSGEQPGKRDEMLAVAPLASAPWAITIRQPEAEVYAVVHRLRRNILLISLGATIIALGGTGLGTRLFTYRLRLLSRYSRHLSQGELSTPAPVLGYDEVGAVTKELEEMRQKLQASSAELEERARQRTAELATLYAIDRMSVQALPLEQLLQQALARIIEATAADGGGIRLAGDGDSLVMRVYQGYSSQFVPRVRRIKIGEGVSGQAAQQRQVLQTKLTEYPSERLLPDVTAEGFQVIAAAPMLMEDRLVGTVTLVRHQERLLTEEELNFLQAAASQLALSLERARLYEEARHSAEINALLHRNSVALSTMLDEPSILKELVQEALKETGADYASVLLPDEKREVLLIAAEAPAQGEFQQAIARAHAEAPLRVGEGITGRVFASGKPLLAEDYAKLPDAPPSFVPAGIRSGLYVPLQAGEQVLGVVKSISHESHHFTNEHLLLLQTIAGHAASAILNARLYQQEKRMRQQLQSLAAALDDQGQMLVQAYQTMATSIVQLLETRDPYTRGHSDRVRHYCHQVAHRLGLTPQEIADLDQAAQLHDLGKIGIPDQILHKPTTPSPVEWMELRLHPEKTEALLSSFPFLKKALPLMRSHHERWDGNGYPDNLAGEKIPRGARIMAAADAYDAMTSDRPYRKALSHQEAVEELKKGAGTQWEPQVVEAFIQVLSEEQPPTYSR